MSVVSAETLAKLHDAVHKAATAEQRVMAQTLLDMARAANDAVTKAEARAEEAETKLANAAPTMRAMAKHAESLAEQLQASEHVVDDLAKRERVAKREAADEADAAAVLPALARAMKTLETSFEKSVDILTAIAKLTKGPDGRNALRCKAEYGHWQVLDPDTDRVAVVERRSDAVALVKAMVEAKWAEKDVAAEIGAPRSHQDLDDLDERREKFPQLPADAGFNDTYDRKSGGRIDGRKLRTKRQIRKGYLT